MKEALHYIGYMFWEVMRSMFSHDLHVMDRDVAILLSNKDTAKQYKQAVDDVQSGRKESVTIQVNKYRSITIIQ